MIIMIIGTVLRKLGMTNINSEKVYHGLSLIFLFSDPASIAWYLVCIVRLAFRINLLNSNKMSDRKRKNNTHQSSLLSFYLLLRGTKKCCRFYLKLLADAE